MRQFGWPAATRGTKLQSKKKEIVMKGERKEERFKRIARRRVQRVIDSIRSLSQCSNKRMYEWSDEQLNKIWGAIDKELETCKVAFESAEPEEFRL
jgi:hypothetical protein